MAQTYDQRVREVMFGLLPMGSSRCTFAVCCGCGVLLQAKLHAEALIEMTADELSGLLYFPSTALQKSIAVIALIVAVIPIIGFGMSLLAVVGCWGVRSWPRKVSSIALAISLLVSLLLGGLLVLGKVLRW